MTLSRSIALSILGSQLPALADWLSDAPEEVAVELVSLVALVKQEARAKECEACLGDYFQAGVGAAEFFRDRAERIRRGAL